MYSLTEFYERMYTSDRHRSRITQLVECETVNLKVEGSIPSVRALDLILPPEALMISCGTSFARLSLHLQIVE